MSGQTGTLVLDIQGQVLSATGELRGTSGEIAAETIYSMLQDSGSVLDASQKEELQRMTSKGLRLLKELLNCGATCEDVTLTVCISLLQSRSRRTTTS